MRCELALLLLAGLGCSHDFDDLYAGGRDAAEEKARAKDALPADVPILPALPDPDRIEACERCATSTCSAERMECLKDDDCTDELRCRGERDDPAGMQICSARYRTSAWYRDYASCVFGKCRDECNTGDNFACAHDYVWPDADPEATVFEITFVFQTAPSFWLGPSVLAANVPGETVLACFDRPQCDAANAAASAAVDLDGTVTLQLGANDFPPRDFRGFLQLDGDSPGRVYLAPLAAGQHYYAPYVSAPLNPPASYHQGEPFLRVGVADCLGAAVAGARVTLPDLPEAHVLAVDLNELLAGAPLGYAEGPTTAAGVAYVLDLPASARDERLRVRAERDTGELISERAVFLRSEAGTHLTLLPAARND